LRRFRTAPANRSQTTRQFVIAINLFSVKEIVFTQKLNRKRGRPAKTQRLAYRQLSNYLIIVGLLGISFFCFQTLKAKALVPIKTFTQQAPLMTKPAAAVPVSYKSLPRSVPAYISIPSVGIAAPIITVGQDAAGGVQMPPLFDWSTGWYKYSPTPGEIGPSVIVGHVDNYKNISVFWRLRYVQKGDTIDITRTDGSIAHFVVTALQQFDQNNFPTQQVYGNTPDASLRLITCGGTFNNQTESYTQNTVVFASLIT
jgi:sortase (surface protein transpeptidase)